MPPVVPDLPSSFTLDCYVILIIALGQHKLLVVLEALLTETQEATVAASLKAVFRWLRVGNAARGGSAGAAS